MILIVVLFLLVSSIVVVYSASSSWALNNPHIRSAAGLVNKHIVKVLIGFVVMFFAINIDYRKYKPLTLWVLLGAVVLLIVTRIAGSEAKGAVRWISTGGVNLQPSEVAKFALIFHLATLLSSKGTKLQDFKKGFVPLLFWVGLVVVLVMIQPNFSTGAIICVLGMLMIFIGGARLKHVLLSLSALLPALVVYMISAPYRMKRILSYIGFANDDSGIAAKDNYQLLQGIIGFGNGGIFGVGMGMSKQRDLFLPESYGDFIFSIVGEEYGIIGTVLFLLIFLLILSRGLRIAKYAPDDFGKFLAIGITTTIVLYALANTLVTLGLVPTTGVPMPFVSYGGTAIISSCYAIGVLLNISSQTDLHPRISEQPAVVSVEQEPAVGRVY